MVYFLLTSGHDRHRRRSRVVTLGRSRFALIGQSFLETFKLQSATESESCLKWHLSQYLKLSWTSEKYVQSQSSLRHKSNIHQIVGVNAETVTNVTSTDFPGHYPGEDHTWDVQIFKDVCDNHYPPIAIFLD